MKMRNIMRSRVVRVAIFLLSFSILPATVFAADYPAKSINFMIPFSPGGATDTSGRAIADAMEKTLNVSIVPENRTGGGGSVGWTWLARQKPDGYNIGIATVSIILQQYTGVSGVRLDQFAPIGMIAYADAAISVKADSPFKTLKDLMDYAKKNPGIVTISNSGTGSIWHLAAAGLEATGGVKFNHVPFKGGKNAVLAMLGGHVAASGSAVGEVLNFVQAGKARILAIAGTKRFSKIPDVPTFKEEGYDISVGCLFGLLAPAGTPPEIIKILSDACYKGTQDPEYRKIQDNFGNDVRAMNAEDFAKALKTEDKVYHEIIKKVGLEKK